MRQVFACKGELLVVFAVVVVVTEEGKSEPWSTQVLRRVYCVTRMLEKPLHEGPNGLISWLSRPGRETISELPPKRHFCLLFPVTVHGLLTDFLRFCSARYH